MDEILEPADQEELAKKIESSEFANDLILRTKDTMRRLRLSAPQLIGTGIGLDPNTVAEYLDNVLPPDSVADLERICLESDVHLAEVASCHHVLTMVLGEPAEVDPTARERMYRIPADAKARSQVRVDPAHAAAIRQPAAVAAPMPPAFTPTTALPVADKSRDIPDYLRASAWSHYRLPLLALAAVLVIGIAYLLTSGLKGWRNVSAAGGDSISGALVGQRQASSETDQGVPALPAPSSDHLALAAPSNSSPQQPAGNSVDAYAVAHAPTSQALSGPPPILNPPMSGAPTTTAPAATVPATEAPSSANPEQSAGGSTAAPPANAFASGAPAITGGGADAMKSDAVGPANETPSTTTAPTTPPLTSPNPNMLAANTPMKESAPAISSQPANGSSLAAPASTTSAKVAEKVAERGTYLDGKEILLRNDPQSAEWFRLVPRSAIHAKDRLVALPAFHPRITLASGIQMKLSGGTEVGFDTADALPKADSATPHSLTTIDVIFGRVVLQNTSNVENALDVKVGASNARVRLEPNATLAVEVLHSYVPGRDPRQSPSPVLAHFYVPDGNISWSDGDGEQTIHAPSQWDIADGVRSPIAAATSLPDWIDHEPAEERTEQQYAAPIIDESLDAKRPAREQLLELFQSSRRREVKSLVARSSVYVGLFQPFVEALRDSDQKGTWTQQIETLRAAMALGPDAANQVWETLKEQRGEPAANDLYEMLCGYSSDQVGHTADQVVSGAIPRLIDWLENESLDYRVLAVEDLRQITGKQLMTNPAGAAATRAQAVKKWRDRLKAGELVPVPAAKE
jgi:hypothetical protein